MDPQQIALLTFDQLKQFAETVVKEYIQYTTEPNVSVNKNNASKNYAYGLRGICELFNISISTAHKYKNSFLKPAIIQRGRKIIVDVEMARKLFEKESNKV